MGIFLPLYAGIALLALMPFFLWNYFGHESFQSTMDSWDKLIGTFLSTGKKEAAGGVQKTGEAAKNTALAALIGVLAYLPKMWSIGSAVAGFVRNPEDAANKGTIVAVREQLGALIKEATLKPGQRFVIFVDDVERCQSPKPIEILEAVNQLVDHENVVVVLLGDMSAVAANAGLKYKDLAKVHNPDSLRDLDEKDAIRLYGYRYMQKIVQLQFDVPSDVAISPRTRSSNEDQEDQEDWLREAAREAFKTEKEVIRSESGEGRDLTGVDLLLQPIRAYQALQGSEEMTGLRKQVAQGAQVALAAVQACFVIPFGISIANLFSEASSPMAEFLPALGWALLLFPPAIATFVRAGYSTSFRPQLRRLPYLMTKVAIPPVLFFYEQIRFPSKALSIGDRSRLAFLTLLQGFFSLSFLGAVALTFNFTYEAFFSRETVNRVSVVGSMLTVLFFNWVFQGTFALGVRKAFDGVIRDGIQQLLKKLAEDPKGQHLDPEAAKDQVFKMLAGIRLSERQKKDLQTALGQQSGFLRLSFQRQKQQQMIGNDVLVNDALLVALKWLPPLPRNAKRIRNAVRLLLYVLSVRKMVPGQVSAESIGKWAALREGWPHVAEQILQDPTFLDRLEPEGAVADEKSIDALVRSELKAHSADRRLRRLLADPYPLTPFVKCIAKLDLDPQEGGRAEPFAYAPQ